MLGLMMPLKDRVRELRKAAGLTQQSLAVKAGMSVAAVVQIESGKTPDPRLSTLRALAKAMGVRVEELIGNEESGHPEQAPPEPPPPDPPKRPRKGKGAK
jgi:transcriptional regulator with XRE-family HTH domain